MFKSKKFQLCLYSSDRNNFLFFGISTLNGTKHSIKPKEAVRDQKCKDPLMFFFRVVNFLIENSNSN